MAFLSLTTTKNRQQIDHVDIDLSFELSKHPRSGLQAQPLREGTLYGFYSRKGQKYNLFFQDHPLKSSYSSLENSDIEYNDLNRYVDPYLYLTMLDKGISVKATEKNTHLTNNIYKLKIVSLQVSRINILESLKRDLADSSKIEIQTKLLAGTVDIFEVHFTGKDTNLFTFLQNVKIFLLLVIPDRRDDAALDDAQIIKYLQHISNLDLSYQLRHRFKVNYLTPSLFARYLQVLNESSKHKTLYKFTFGSNGHQRKEFILEQVKRVISNQKTYSILDIGAGVSLYFKPVHKILQKEAERVSRDFNYYAIDKDEEVLEDFKDKLNRNKLTNVTCFQSLEAFVASNSKESKNKEPLIVLLSEVIEHNSIENSKQIFALLSQLNVAVIIMTTPNRDFNKYYNLEQNALRDVDHVYEFNKEELSTFCKELLLDYSILEVGDAVDEISTTFGVVLTPKQN